MGSDDVRLILSYVRPIVVALATLSASFADIHLVAQATFSGAFAPFTLRIYTERSIIVL